MRRRLFGLFLLLPALLSCGDGDAAPRSVPSNPDIPDALTPVSESPDSLRGLATQRGLLLGAAIDPGLLNDDVYAGTLAREFNLIATENVLKLRVVGEKPNTFDFRQADRAVDFALRNGMQVRGTTLVWHRAIPGWLTRGSFDRDESMEILERYIKTTVARYQGRIYYWDVVNEAFDDDGQLRNSFWLRTIGPEYIELAFRWAHEADPDAKLFYNDYGAEGLNPKSEAIFALVSDMIGRGVPIHGVGIQGHMTPDDVPATGDIRENVARLGGLGLDVHFTEVDVRLAEPVTPEQLAAQADTFRVLLEACLEETACEAFTLWGFTDASSWVPEFYPGFGAAQIFDNSYRPKPAYWALIAALKSSERAPNMGRRRCGRNAPR